MRFHSRASTESSVPPLARLKPLEHYVGIDETRFTEQ
jgi:hypothetical protein